jgi:dGTPase
MEMQFPGATPRERFYEALRHLIDALVSGLIEGTVDRARESGAGSADEVRAVPHRLAAFTAAAARTSRELKQFLYRKVYASHELGEGRTRSMAMIEELFQFFLDHPERLPQGYREQSENQPPHRVTCDYIAGMTDGFFRRTYEATLGEQGLHP